MFSLPQLHTKSLCVLALQNSQFEASTSSRPQTVNFEALGHKAILIPLIARCVDITSVAEKCTKFQKLCPFVFYIFQTLEFSYIIYRQDLKF